MSENTSNPVVTFTTLADAQQARIEALAALDKARKARKSTKVAKEALALADAAIATLTPASEPVIETTPAEPVAETTPVEPVTETTPVEPVTETTPAEIEPTHVAPMILLDEVETIPQGSSVASEPGEALSAVLANAETVVVLGERSVVESGNALVTAGEQSPVTGGEQSVVAVKAPAPKPVKTAPPKVDDVVTGKVIKVLAKDKKPFGVLVEFDGHTGLLHVSKLDAPRGERDAKLEAMKPGDEVTAEVIEVGNDEKKPGKLRISLSERAARIRLFVNSLPGTEVEGIVNGKADYGVFVDLSDEIRGLLHVLQLEGLREQRDQRLASLKTGDKVTVEVTKVTWEKGRPRIELSEKRLAQRRFLAALSTGPEGSVMKGDIVKVTEGGFEVALSRGLVGFLPYGDLGKASAGSFKKGNTVRVRVEAIDLANLTVTRLTRRGL